MIGRRVRAWRSRWLTIALLILAMLVAVAAAENAGAADTPATRLTQPGQSLWSLSIRTGTSLQTLATTNATIHPALPYPVAGTPVAIPPAVRPEVGQGSFAALFPCGIMHMQEWLVWMDSRTGRLDCWSTWHQGKAGAQQIVQPN